MNIRKEFLQELVSKSKENKLIEKEYITNFIDSILYNHNVNTKFRNIFDAYAEYGSNEISVDYNKIANSYKYFIKGKEKNYFESNLEILHIILHEMEHFYQDFKVNHNNLEGIILNYGINSLTKKAISTEKTVNDIYDKTYNINPSERLADYYAAKYLLEVIENNKDLDKFNELYDIANNLLIDSMMRGYRKVDGKFLSIPFKEYMIKTGCESKLNNLSFYSYDNKKFYKLASSNMNLEERFKYGFIVKNTEYNYLLSKKKIIV